MKIVAYYRVSTKRQGLGLEAQRDAVAQFAKNNKWIIDSEFAEKESGADNDRPELQKAIALAKNIRGTLVIAKLDRLSRSVAFTAALMESKVDFICCDNPTANPFTIHILAAVAEHERKLISERTKAALTVAANRGRKLGAKNRKWQNRAAEALATGDDWREKGTKRGLKKARAASIKKRRDSHDELRTLLVADVKARRAAGESYAAIAQHLTEQGRHTCEGSAKFYPNTVRRLLLA
jgi:DNA invertase Pin-like site-specific DNA recombinase